MSSNLLRLFLLFTFWGSFLTASCTSSGFKVFHIDCDPDSLEYIRSNYKQEIKISANFTHADRTWKDVKLRLRGDSSKRKDKKSLKVIFNRSELFSGDRRKLNFNAEATDPSMVRAWLASRLFQESGQVCFQTEHAAIYMNGEYYGLYLMVENVDKRFLKTRELSFKDNLYKATKDSACLSIFDKPELYWEKKTNKEVPGYSDLKELINMLNNTPDSEYFELVKKIMVYDQMVNIIAMNMLLCNHSTYYHNYYMYHHSDTDRWEMFPWDLDKTFEEDKWDSPYQRGNNSDKQFSFMASNPFFERALVCEPIFKDIQIRVDELEKNVFNVGNVAPLLDSLQDVLRPYISMDSPFGKLEQERWGEEMDGILKFIKKRPHSLREQLKNSPYSFKMHRVPVGTGFPIRLKWEATRHPAGKEIWYELKVCTDPLYPDEKAWIFTNLKENQFTIKQLPPGRYYWKVYARDGRYKVAGFDNRNYFRVPPPAK